MERPEERLDLGSPEYHERVDTLYLTALDAFDRHEEYVRVYHRYKVAELQLRGEQGDFIVLEMGAGSSIKPLAKNLDCDFGEPKIGRFILGSDRSADQYHGFVYRDGLMFDCVERGILGQGSETVQEDPLTVDDLNQFIADINSWNPVDQRPRIVQKIFRYLDII